MEYPKYQWSKMSPDRSEQVVIRTDNPEELAELIDAAKSLLPQSKPFPDDTGPKAVSPEQTQSSEGVCKIHNVAMKQRQGQYGPFWSHGRKLPDGSFEYCNGKKGYPTEA